MIGNLVCEHIVSITFNNEPVVGSPFNVQVTADLDNVSVSGAALHFAPVNTTAVLTVHNIAQERDLFVKIEGPNGQVLPATLKQEAHSTAVTIEFYPLMPGEHLIHLSYKGAPIPGSPFSSKVYDIRQIRVKEMPKEAPINKTVTFLVEAADAGSGHLEVIVNKGAVASTPQALGPSLYAISFVPKDPEPHVIEIKFNGLPIEGAPFVCHVLDAGRLTVRRENLERIPINALATFAVEGGALNPQHLTILGPSQQPVEHSVAGDPISGYKVSFVPHEVGDHVIDIKVLGESVPSCPFLVKCYDSKNVKISDMSSAAVGKPVFFSIDASQAGAGNLEIIVSVNGRNVPNYGKRKIRRVCCIIHPMPLLTVQSEGNAKFRVNFKPIEASPHTVSVKFNSEPVPGSPYIVPIADNSQSVLSGQALKMASISKKVEFTIENKNDVKECKVFVTSKRCSTCAQRCQQCALFSGPSGKKLRANVAKAVGMFNISFLPLEVGPHQIVALLDGVVLGAPVSCNVFDVSKVKVTGLNTAYIGKCENCILITHLI